MKCKHCGEVHPDDYLFCPATGKKIEPDKLICKVCGNKSFPEKSKFCPCCGTELDGQKSKQKSDKLTNHNKYEAIEHIWGSWGLFWIKCNGKWGIMNSNLEEIFPCCLNDYDHETNEKFIGVSRCVGSFEDEDITNYGYIDYQGNQVIPCIYDRAFISGESDSFVLEKDGKCGVINSKGVTLVPFKWDNIAYFSQGLAGVKMGNRCGFININGDIAIPIEYEETHNFNGAGYANVKKGGHWGVIDIHNNVIVPFVYDNALTSSNEEECDNISIHQLFLVSQDSQWSVIDVNGNKVCDIPGKYKSAWIYCNTVIQLFTYDDRKCRFYRIDTNNFISGYYESNSRLGKYNGTFYIRACTEQYDEIEEDFVPYDYLMDIDENVIIESEDYNVTETPRINSGLIEVNYGKLYGVVDINGNPILPCKFSRIDIDYYGKSIIAYQDNCFPTIYNIDGSVLLSNK